MHPKKKVKMSLVVVEKFFSGLQQQQKKPYVQCMIQRYERSSGRCSSGMRQSYADLTHPRTFFTFAVWGGKIFGKIL